MIICGKPYATHPHLTCVRVADHAGWHMTRPCSERKGRSFIWFGHDRKGTR